MNTPILLTPVSIESSDGIGFLATHRVTTSKGDHHSFTWRIDNFESIPPTYKPIKSPSFTVPNHNQCSWHLNVRGVRIRENGIASCVQLVLNDTSDCKGAVVKFAIFNPGFCNNVHRDLRNYVIESGKTCEFETKLDNIASTACYCVYNCNGKRESGSDLIFTIICNILIEKVLPKVNSLSDDIGELLKNQSTSDFMIKVDGKNYPVHKTILACRSPVFAAMFARDTIENNESAMVIRDVDEDVVEEMLMYIYTGKVERWNLAEELLMAADKYGLKGLRFECAQYLISTLSNSNVFELLLLAKYFNLDVLKSAAIKFIIKNNKKVVKTSAWKTLCQAEPELLGEICEALFLQLKITN